jgi:hypothetical protein
MSASGHSRVRGGLGSWCVNGALSGSKVPKVGSPVTATHSWIGSWSMTSAKWSSSLRCLGNLKAVVLAGRLEDVLNDRHTFDNEVAR